MSLFDSSSDIANITLYRVSLALDDFDEQFSFVK
jgi:hypothetical protein